MALGWVAVRGQQPFPRALWGRSRQVGKAWAGRAPGAGALCWELCRAVPGRALPAASPGPTLAAALAEPGLR